MKQAGLDTSMFTPHSLRSASTSAALKRKMPIHTILETEGRSKDNTFRKYYNKEVASDEALQNKTNQKSD